MSGQRFPCGAHGSGAEHCPRLTACHCLGIHVTYDKEHKIKTIRILIIIADNNSDNNSDNDSDNNS